MGLSPLKKCSSNPYAPEGSGNPDPKHWLALEEWSWVTCSGQEVLVARVRYPQATNYEGEKILLYIGFRNLDQVAAATGGELDPHFAETRFAPIARFRPTQIGWKMATDFAKTIL